MTPERFVHYKVGVDCIDNEHYKMLTEMTDVVSTAKSGDVKLAKEKLEASFNSISEHFEREEKFMKAINYKFIDSHIESHRYILIKIREIINHLSEHGKMINDYARIFEDIFVGHIDYLDMQYADYIKENNLDTTGIY